MSPRASPGLRFRAASGPLRDGAIRGFCRSGKTYFLVAVRAQASLSSPAGCASTGGPTSGTATASTATASTATGATASTDTGAEAAPTPAPAPAEGAGRSKAMKVSLIAAPTPNPTPPLRSHKRAGEKQADKCKPPGPPLSHMCGDDVRTEACVQVDIRSMARRESDVKRTAHQQRSKHDAMGPRKGVEQRRRGGQGVAGQKAGRGQGPQL